MMAVKSRLFEKKLGGKNIQSDAKIRDFFEKIFLGTVSYFGKKFSSRFFYGQALSQKVSYFSM